MNKENFKKLKNYFPSAPDFILGEAANMPVMSAGDLNDYERCRRAVSCAVRHNNTDFFRDKDNSKEDYYSICDTVTFFYKNKPKLKNIENHLYNKGLTKLWKLLKKEEKKAIMIFTLPFFKHSFESKTTSLKRLGKQFEKKADNGRFAYYDFREYLYKNVYSFLINKYIGNVSLSDKHLYNLYIPHEYDDDGVNYVYAYNRF